MLDRISSSGILGFALLRGLSSVSYTHLDVYKRQVEHSRRAAALAALRRRARILFPMCGKIEFLAGEASFSESFRGETPDRVFSAFANQQCEAGSHCQKPDSAAHSACGTCNRSPSGFPCALMSRTVSYTHLDVYKRQAWNRAACCCRPSMRRRAKSA